MSTLFWFRRDLRVFANEALITAVNKGATRAIFFIAEQQWQQHQIAPIARDLMLRRVRYLGETLAQYGIYLHIEQVQTYQQIPAILAQFCQQHGISQVYANHEYEINEQQRDQQCMQQGVNLSLFHGDVIAPPQTIRTKDNTMFKVFTPFKRAWLKQYQQQHFSLSLWQQPLNPIAWHDSERLNLDNSSHKWPVDDDTLATITTRFIDEKFNHYHDTRDFPAQKGTSGLSPYLAWGMLSVKQVLIQVQQRYPDILQSEKSNLFSWVNELIWREFYRHLLVEYPKLCKHYNFSDNYNHVAWRTSEQDFSAWCEGKTGYPLVDAAMRQLTQTGWMHNRLRMVVASFLTKHLLIDWRKGEQFFMQHLIDGDLASNNGGWQWAASTGCDAQPYFRIFNPITQSKRFDPDGEFIRKYIPELASVPNKAVHFPHDYLAKTNQQLYWPPIVEHRAARERALAMFKK